MSLIKVGDELSQKQAMDLALKVAEMGRGMVSPNPLVGCTLVDREHRFLSSGAHLKYGDDHAEVNALKNLKDPAHSQGATAYVTLEPCSHFGKQPPCTEALIAAKVGKVIYGMLDPNPLVAGKGVKHLKDHNIEVGHFVTYQKKCEHLVEEFLHLLERPTPFVTLKLASSIDGKIALDSGVSKWITGPETRVHARNLRAQSDATLIGAGTLINDDPTLDFRQTVFENLKKNKIVIFDPKGKAAKVFETSVLRKIHSSENIFVVSTDEGLSAWKNAECHKVAWQPSYQGWWQALKVLRNLGVVSIFVEGGGFAISQFLQYKLAQKIHIYQAPKIIGQGKGWSEGLRIRDLDSALPIKDWQQKAVGGDILITGRF